MKRWRSGERLHLFVCWLLHPFWQSASGYSFFGDILFDFSSLRHERFGRKGLWGGLLFYLFLPCYFRTLVLFWRRLLNCGLGFDFEGFTFFHFFDVCALQAHKHTQTYIPNQRRGKKKENHSFLSEMRQTLILNLKLSFFIFLCKCIYFL